MSSSAKNYHRPHVLIVTDDEDLREFLSDGLVLAGFWASTVASALQTLEIFRLRTFDLAIVDLALGGMSGIELIRRLRGQPGTFSADTRTDIPILALVDDPVSPIAEEAMNAGADGLLAPPIELEELAVNLNSVVRMWRDMHPDRPYADEVAQRQGEASD
jgi:DNA-binding response OmpR family regulator